jgi:hypothetical protein
MTTQLKTTTWRGTPSEFRDLLSAVQNNCTCAYTRGVRTHMCAGHRMVIEDQRALNGLRFVRRLAARLRGEEDSVARPLAARANGTDQWAPRSMAQRGQSSQPDALEPSAPLARQGGFGDQLRKESRV